MNYLYLQDKDIPVLRFYMYDKLKNMIKLPSKFEIGDPVILTLQGKEIYGHVRTITFTSGKVRYSVRVPLDIDTTEETGDYTTLHNIDSILLTETKDKPKIKLEFDNYS